MEFQVTAARIMQNLSDPSSDGGGGTYGLLHSIVLDAYVQVGDFVIVEHTNGTVVGRLIETSKLDNVCIDELSLDDDDYFYLDNGTKNKMCGLIQIWKKPESGSMGYVPLVAQDRYKLNSVTELVETNNAMWLGSNNIVNLAFVFSPEELKDGRHPPFNGMANLFFARYKYYDGQNTTYEQLGLFCSFSTSYGYSYRLFSSLSHIRNEIDKVLYRVGMSQGDVGYIRTYLPVDCWRFMSSFFRKHSNVIHFKDITKRLCTKRNTYDLSQQKVRIGTVLEIAVVDTKEGLKMLCKLLGLSVGIGVRKVFPRIGLPVTNMGTGDTINIVSPTETNKNKFVFRYDSVASSLSVVVRYSKWVYRETTAFLDAHGGNPQVQFLSPIFNNNENNNEDPADNLNDEILNCQLEVSNRIYTVDSIQQNSVRVVADDGSRSSLHLDIADANDLVDEYNLLG